MNTYELTYIISSKISSEEADSVKNEVESFIQSKEGVVIKSEKMGAQPLSYTILKHGSGYFNTVVFQLQEDKIKEVKGSIDKNSNILRNTIVIKKPMKVMKERRPRRPMFTKEFELNRKPSIIKLTEEQKKGEKVDAADLDKKLDEILSE